MAEQPKIRSLSDLLGSHLNKNEEIISHSTSLLTQPGENYGSTMLSLQVKIRNSITEEEKVLPLVAKMSPPNEFLKHVFQTHISFIKENLIYTDVNPALIKLQIEKGVPENEVIDVFPKCYGARISLNPDSTIVDADAVLLLENLKASGYIMGDRAIGYDLDTTKVVLQYLSYFHALPIALRMQKPEVFAKKVLPALKRLNMADTMSQEEARTFQKSTLDSLTQSKELGPYLERIAKAFKDDEEYQSNELTPLEPFATAVHNDFWVNNMMLKLDKNNKADMVKILDFQVTFYHSLGHDVIFFLFSSVQNDVLINHYDELISHYYKNFIATLKKVDCKLDESFSYENFLKELDDIAPKRFSQLVFMLKMLLAKKESIDELKDFDMDSFSRDDLVNQEYLDKVTGIILMFVERKWLL